MILEILSPVSFAGFLVSLQLSSPVVWEPILSSSGHLAFWPAQRGAQVQHEQCRMLPVFRRKTTRIRVCVCVSVCHLPVNLHVITTSVSVSVCLACPCQYARPNRLHVSLYSHKTLLVVFFVSRV